MGLPVAFGQFLYMSILAPQSFECFSHGEEQTERIGARLGELLPSGVVIALSGQLGAGKTHFARGIGFGWGAQQELRSPTFTMVQEHRRNRPGGLDRLYHIDLYRISNDSDLRSLGLDELIEDENAVVMIEWPERAPSAIPRGAIWVTMNPLSETRRQILFASIDAQNWLILLRLRKLVFGA